MVKGCFAVCGEYKMISSCYNKLKKEGMILDQKKIGAFIALLRRECGITQAELGERIGVTNKTVSRW